ncbi:MULTISPECIES: LysE family transporter [unclassified Clostridium]|uniref:LysE/ArgO family amino acid transporter n=1 Tax=unclassified Clostridium TaxID=2614128 RepID=UPI00023AFD40|nr:MULTISPECIES: LysE family transporter [unclassified Clostridium]EHI98951.1 Lysine exporter protein (LYSE/YGGA) [Clostridium sp. DL-VIII]OOM76516.1 arginine exporter protein ArgO [Clostridium sp. BL-8]
MIKYLLQGLLFGLAYVAPIGTQNLYVINTALKKSRLDTYKVALITIFFDISLAISCFFGIGFLIQKYFELRLVVLLLGCIIVTHIGIGLIKSASQVSDNKNIDNSLIRIIISCFAVTWLNPQAIIDGSLLLGGFNASLPLDMSRYFILGVCLASFLWFNSLSMLIVKFRNKLNKIIKWINIICGAILIFYGLKLGYSFIELI